MNSYDNIWDEIKYRISLTIEMEKHGIHLISSGRRLKCICPFHADNDPSMCVNIESDVETYKCFGCGVKGSVIDFIMKIRNYSYSQTLKYFNDEYGLEFSKDVDIIKLLNNPTKKNKIIPIYPYQSKVSRCVYSFFKEYKGNYKEALMLLHPYLIRIDEAANMRDKSYIEYETIKLSQHIKKIKRIKV